MSVSVFLGEALAQYHFGVTHPFGPKRYSAFAEEFTRLGMSRETQVLTPIDGHATPLQHFHAQDYINTIALLSKRGYGSLDCGDTPARAGIYEAALCVVATTLAGVEAIMSGKTRRVFTPIGGLHHARRSSAAGFCVFNDCGVAIEVLRKDYGIRRIAYVDIDAHHGDGVFYSYAADPELFIVDMHEDGRFLYPGSGFAEEIGVGAAAGTKLNIPLPPGADDEAFMAAWPRAEALLRRAQPEFILLQCGADSIRGDPLTHLRYSAQAHFHATRQVCRLADALGHGRVLAMGGGGYNLQNIAQAWTAVVKAMC